MDEPTSSLAARLRDAFTARDLDAFGSLLAEDVRWGDDDHPRACRNRTEVLAAFSRGMLAGVGADITELVTGELGILCGLRLRWPTGHERAADRDIYQVYLVGNGRIVEIRRYDDRVSAGVAAGLAKAR
ncbi:MAG: nuclear transport factor 2 family protein [Acidimicrobiales bacterium]